MADRVANEGDAVLWKAGEQLVLGEVTSVNVRGRVLKAKLVSTQGGAPMEFSIKLATDRWIIKAAELTQPVADLVERAPLFESLEQARGFMLKFRAKAPKK